MQSVTSAVPGLAAFAGRRSLGKEQRRRVHGFRVAAEKALPTRVLTLESGA